MVVSKARALTSRWRRSRQLCSPRRTSGFRVSLPGLNNAVARTGSLIAVAVLPLAAGITGDAFQHPAQLTAGFGTALEISAGILAAGGVLAWVLIRDRE